MRLDVPRLAVRCTITVLALTLSGCAPRAPETGRVAPVTEATELDRIRAAVDATIAAPPPRGYAPMPPGVRLRSIARADDGAILMDFSRELLAGGTGRALEDALHRIFTAASAARSPAPGRIDRYTVLVDGASLETYLR